jgi:hypothetical protein
VSKIKVAAGTLLGVSVAAVLGVAAGILMVHGPANAPVPAQTPAANVQPFVAGDPTDTTTDPATSTTTEPQAAPPATTTTAPVVTTTAPAAPSVDTSSAEPTRNSTWAPMPTTATTTTTPVWNCVPDGTGATVCH